MGFGFKFLVQDLGFGFKFWF